MPTVEFSFPELTKFLGKNISPEKLKHPISMLGVDLEEINQEKVKLEVFPNRPDLLGIEGFSRALKGVLNLERALPEYPLKKSSINLSVDKSVKEVRPYITGGLIKKVSLTENFLISLMNIQEKLHLTNGRNRKKVAIGLHDLSKVEPPFTYKAVPPQKISFKPLDMNEKLNLQEILEKHPKGRKYAFTLQGKKKYPIILDNQGRVLSFPPIINGELTRVTRKTTEIFIDITGEDEKAINQALNILMTTFADRGGELYSIKIIG